MGKDVGWKGYFSDDERYADIINGIGCKGRQVVKKEDLQEMDTQTGFLHGPKFLQKLPAVKKNHVKIRDSIRRAAFGVNFAIVGIENQEVIDYSIPLRNMSYDVGTYEKQAAKLRKEVRKNRKDLSEGEYLYGFRRDSHLYPTVTFILYSGTEPWDGPKSLRCSQDKKALKELVERDDYYKSMEEDAFDVAVQYTNATELIEAKEYYEGGSVNMCQALTELIADGRTEGRMEGIELTKRVYKAYIEGKSNETIARECNIPVSQVEKILE